MAEEEEETIDGDGELDFSDVAEVGLDDSPAADDGELNTEPSMCEIE